jgi:hypothetical protein
MNEISKDTQTLTLIRARVRNLLSRSPSFAALEERQRESLAQDMVKVAAYIVEGKGSATVPTSVTITRKNTLTRSKGSARARVKVSDTSSVPANTQHFLNFSNQIDFPDFVAGLINGVFESIVDASIEQMRAYAELLKNVAASIDEFVEDNSTKDDSRDCLSIQSTQDRENTADQEPLVPADRRRLALDRQESIATQIMMGIHRIVATQGSIKTTVSFDVKPKST